MKGWRGVTSERLRLSISPRKNVVLFKNLNTGVRDYKYTWKANVLNDFRRVKSTLTVLASPVLDAVKLLTIIRVAMQKVVNT